MKLYGRTHLSASEWAKKLAGGEVTSVELLQECVDRSREPGLENVFIELTLERALTEAHASDQRRSKGSTLSKWDGVPVAWKDLFDFAGLVTTAGSRVFCENLPATQDANVVAACHDQGLIAFGKTNLSEFAYSGLGLNPHYGTPANPFSGQSLLVPGGSSSGSAVAVAGGITPIAVGTDTAGSIRVPASFCGLFGFKASENRYSKRGCFPLSTTLDSFGGFAHCGEDLTLLDAAMRGAHSVETSQINIEDCCFFIPDSVVFENIDSEVLQVFEDLVAQLTDAGASIKRGAFDIFDEVSEHFKIHGTLTGAEAAVIHEELLASDRAEDMDQRVRKRMLTSRDQTISDYIKLQWARQNLKRRVREELGQTFLLFPTIAIRPPLIADLETSDDYFTKTNALVLRNTMLGSFLGTPGISFPAGLTRDGLPVGALISAPSGDDDRVLAIAPTLDTFISFQATKSKNSI